MTQVTEPFPIFYDDDGTPLGNGMIYVGEANQDPRTNPVTVYTDEARTVPIAQPIRTLDGRPAYQGAPVNLYLNEPSYSISVQNRFGSLVTSAPVVSDEDALTGALTSTWRRFPSICRLLLNGTGTITIDARNKAGAITSAVFTETVTGASNAVRFPYFGDDAFDVRATLTGSATVEII